MSYVIPEGKDSMGELLGLATSIVSEGTFPRPTIINSNNEITNIESTHDSTMYYVSTIVAGLDEYDYPRMFVNFINSFASVNDEVLRPALIDMKNGMYLFVLCFCTSVNENSFSDVSNKLTNTLNNVNNKNSNERTCIDMLLTGGGWYNLTGTSPNENFPNSGWNTERSNDFFVTKDFPHETIKNIWSCNNVNRYIGGNSVELKNGEVLINYVTTNVPIFDNNNSASKWILYGDRSEEIIKLPSVDYTLFIDGDRLPNYNLNWNPDTLGKFSKDAKVYIEFSCLSRSPIDPAYEHFIIKSFPFTDGSIKFNWSDTWQEIDAKIPLDVFITNKFKVEINAVIDDGNVHIVKDKVSVDLYEKKDLLHDNLYDNLVSPSSTGDTLSIDFGEGKDTDDYYNTDSDKSDEHSPTTGYDIGACNLTVCYELSVERLNNIAIKLWSEDFFNNILLLNNSPIENILSCKLLPLSLSGSETPVKIGNVDMGINGNKLSKTVYRYNIGTISIPRISDMGFLNYAPYTSIIIFLPFIGFKELNTSDIMGRNISVDYIVDVITGACKAIITVNNYQCYEFDGNCGIDIPLTAGNRSQVEMGYVKAAVGVVSNIASKNIGGAISSGVSGAMQQYHYSTNGSYSPATGAYEDRTCFVIIDRPLYTEVSKFGHTKGYKCQLTKTIGSLKGFVKTTENVDLSNISAPEYCKKKILDLLSSGIYV